MIITRPGLEAVPIEKVDVSAYTFPTEHPESDGTMAWSATTVVVVEAHAGPVQGLGYSYTTAASAELLRAESPAGDPVLILDDVFAELDAERRRRLAGITAGYEQVLVTAAVEEDIPEVLHRHVVRISAGTITDEREAVPADPDLDDAEAHDG